MDPATQFSCRMYRQVYPEVDDIVMVKITQIAEMGAYVSLLEYNNAEGMILLSELTRKRIRSVNKLIKVGRKEVVIVLRVDKEKGNFIEDVKMWILTLFLGYIDLSKRRVNTEDIARTEERYFKSKTVHSIMKHLAKTENVTLESLYDQFGWPLYETYNHAYDAFKLALQDPDKVFGDLLPPGPMREKLLVSIKHRLTRKAVKIRADIEVSCFTYEGIDAVKEALIEGKKLGTEEEPITIKLVATPLYVMYMTSLEREKGIETINSAIQVIKERIEKSGGTLVVKVEPRAVVEGDDAVLYASEKADQNESDSSDSDDE